jgi:hypothetical protein
MRKYILVVLMLPMLLLVTEKTFAQEESSDLMFGGGVQAISLGYDLYAFRSLFREKTTDFGPMMLKYEYGITRRISLGLNLGFSNTFSTSQTDSLVYAGPLNVVNVERYQKLRKFQSLARANYHLDLSHFDNSFFQDLDVYAGLGLGYGMTNAVVEHSIPYETDGDNLDHFFDVELSIGARYYIEDFVGIYLEYGRSLSSLQFGLTVKF